MLKNRSVPETECFREPSHRVGNILIGEVRQYDVCRWGATIVGK
jgi:hypothetical protein